MHYLLNDTAIASAAPATSSLYGNVASVVKSYLLSRFPRDFFKDVNVSSTLPFRNFKRMFGTNTKKEIVKRGRPRLNIQPSYQIPDDDMFLQGVPLTKNIDDQQIGISSGYLFDVFHDRENGYDLKFKLNHDRIEYDIQIDVRTQHQQLDLYKAMVNQIIWNRAFAHEAALEAIIPKSLILYMSKICGIDIYNHPEMVPIFLQHLNSLGGYPITYKIRNSSSVEEFYMYYKHQVLIEFYDLSIDEGSKKNMLDDSFMINFKVSVEFNLPGLFAIIGRADVAQKLKVTLSYHEYSTINVENDSMEYIPLYTLENLFSNYPHTRGNKTLYGSVILSPEPNEKREDVTFIGDLFTKDTYKVIRTHISYNLPVDTMLELIILKDNQELVEGTDYTINWNTFELTLFNVDHKNFTYRVISYVNEVLVQSTLVAITDDAQDDHPAIKENPPVDFSTMNDSKVDPNIITPKSHD